MMSDAVAARRRLYPEGARVRAKRFGLDTGRRIWPNQDTNGAVVRVVDVIDQWTFAVLWQGPQAEAQQHYPDALWSINDNESVPPGTEGTVRDVDDGGTVFVSWDNGRSIGVTLGDEIERL